MTFLKTLRKIGVCSFSKSTLPERFSYCCCVTHSSLRKILKLYALAYIKWNRFILCVAWNWVSSGKSRIAERWKQMFKTNLARRSLVGFFSHVCCSNTVRSPSPFALTNLTKESIVFVWICPNAAVCWHVRYGCLHYGLFLFLFFKEMIRFITYKESRHSLIGIA